MTIYNSLFDSRLRYGILGWGTASEQNISKLRVIQNKVVRFITFAEFGSRIAPLYANLGVLPLDKQLFLQQTIFMHGMFYNNLPFALRSYCSFPMQKQNTRYHFNKNFTLPLVKTVRGQTSIKYCGPKAWARVPLNIKEIAFRKPFSKNMKELILENQKEANKGILPESTYLKKKKKKIEVL